jgi:hypothetical protein
MTRPAMQETIEFASRMGPVKQLDIEKHLDTDCKSLARMGSLKEIVLHVKRVHFSKQNAPSLLLLLVELAITLFVAGIVVPSFSPFDQYCRNCVFVHLWETGLCDAGYVNRRGSRTSHRLSRQQRKLQRTSCKKHSR